MTRKMQTFLGLLSLVAGLALLAEPTPRLLDVLSCEVDGYVDVLDFGARCDGVTDDRVPIRMAEELARRCIPGRVLPVRYCPATPMS